MKYSIISCNGCSQTPLYRIVTSLHACTHDLNFIPAGIFPPDTATVFRSAPGLFHIPPERIIIDTVAGSARLRCASPVVVNILLLMDTNLLQNITGGV